MAFIPLARVRPLSVIEIVQGRVIDYEPRDDLDRDPVF